MRTTRCFLLAPSLARLIEKERGGHQVTEGYFSDQPRGSTYVRLEEGIGSLILVRHGSGERVEGPTCPAARLRLCSISHQAVSRICVFL